MNQNELCERVPRFVLTKTNMAFLILPLPDESKQTPSSYERSNRGIHYGKKTRWNGSTAATRS